MTPADIAAITRVTGHVVREYTAKSIAPLLDRSAALELRILELETHPAPVAVGPVGPVGQKGDAGASIASLVVSAEGRLLGHLTDGRSLDAGPVPRGKDLTAADVAPVCTAEVDKLFKEQILPRLVLEARTCVEALPKPKDGAPGLQGAPGKDAPLPDGDAIVARMLALVPQPERGPQGERGIDGTSVDVDAIAAQIDARVKAAVASLPVPKDGASFVTGHGPPTATGRPGDAYLDVKTGDVYQWA